MPIPAREIEEAICQVKDQKTFLDILLAKTLRWPIQGKIEQVEDISFAWTADDLRAGDLNKKIIDGKAWQLQSLEDNQPWAIFLLEFKNPDAFAAGRGMTGPLRKILRGLVHSRRKSSAIPSWKREHILFICTHEYQRYRFAYFKSPLEGKGQPPLATFGWGDDVPARTVCEFNLPSLQWPTKLNVTPDEWTRQWAAAFDVEKVTKLFYEDYREAFRRVEEAVGDAATKLTPEERRMFTQMLFNRLMFLRFIERKGWVEFDGSKDYLRALYAAGGIGGKSFYQSRLVPLFFEGLAVEGKQQSAAIGKVPFLNGGLFERSALDDKIADIPDNAFRRVIGEREGLFYRYNFTIEESTPLDIEVAVDPEMLGKVFEELVTGRHESGSYYTPRNVVSFMCREALKGYLAGKSSAPSDAIAALVDEHEVADLTETNAREILDALDNVKAVDPACGSGAYLLGLLGELTAIYRELYNKKFKRDSRSLYDLKLRIISCNLHGVDIDPFATNIAMLRLWLSIAVEADEPMALPNLDFKIEAGDSLLAPVGYLFGVSSDQIDKLVKLQDEYLRTHNKSKGKIKAEVEKLKAPLDSQLRKSYGKNAMIWEVAFAGVLHKNKGFDIALANPPYVRQELIKELKPTLKKIFPEVFTGVADLYCYFYARAIRLLRPGGMLSFISSNKWFRAGYGAKLRKHIADTCDISSITDFGDLPVFESAIAYPMIFVARKRESADQPSAEPIFTKPTSLNPPYPDVLAVIRRDGSRLPHSAIDGGNWTLADAAASSRIATMRAAGVPLGEYVQGQIHVGVKTGFNKAFWIDGETRERLIKADKKSAEIIKPLAVGRDIKRWRIERKDRWLIFTRRGIDIERYPAIEKHLTQFKVGLVPKPSDWDGKWPGPNSEPDDWKGQWPGRKPGRYKWYEIQDDVAYYAAFDKPKIVYPDIGGEATFAFDTTGAYADMTAFVIPVHDLFLLGLLNSMVAENLYLELTAQIRGGYLRFKTQYLKQIPIPDASASDRKAIAALVQKCLDAKARDAAADCTPLESDINARVAALYGL